MKRIFKVLALGVALGILAVIIQRLLNIDDETFMRFYWVAAPLIILGAVAINHVYFRKHIKKMNELQSILESGEAEEFLQQVNAALPTLKSKYLINLYKLNSTAGYCDLKQFETAKNILEELKSETLRGLVKDVHALNLCAVYFYLGENEKAADVFENSKKQFDILCKTKTYGGNINVLKIFMLIYKNDLPAAKELLEQTRENYDKPRLNDDYLFLDEKIKTLNS